MDWFVLDAAADVSTWCGAAGWCKAPSLPFPSISFPSPIQGGCAFVAFLLHYFFLAAFSWMLCEGVVLYNLLVKVFGANDKKWIYIYSALGWGESDIPPTEPAVRVCVGLSFLPRSCHGTLYNITPAVRQEYMCIYIGYYTHTKCLHMSGHITSMAGYAHCVSCATSLQLYPGWGCVCVFSVLYNLSIWSGMFTSLGIPVPFVIISVAARSSLYRIPKSYDTTSPLYSEIRAWVLPRSTPLLLLVWHLYTQTCSLVSQTSFSFAN